MEGKTALVTGGSVRIGRAISLALAKNGVNVIIHYKSSAEPAESLAREIEALGVRAWTIAGDFSRSIDYENLISKAISMAGSLDFLVNSASIFPAETLETATFASLVQNMQVNAWAPFALSREFARLSLKGRIVNLLDARTEGYDWNHIGYILSKHVFTALTRMTALAFAPRITVNGIAPGLILPPPGETEEYLERLVDTVPLRRHGGPEDIAAAVIYFLKSDFVTGAVIHVDGGRHLREYGREPDRSDYHK